jgi:nucleoside-diphosphate-sugar epimerase
MRKEHLLKNILITGGFGFLGTTLTEYLLADPEKKVHVVDDLSTSPVDLEYFLKEVGRPANLTFDICTIQEYFAKKNVGSFDEVYHLASPVGPAGVLLHAGNMVRNIVTDCYLLIDYCIDAGAKLLDVSTSEVYGGGQDGYCPESTPKIIQPEVTVRLEYAVGKLAAEMAISNTCKVKKLNATIVRPFNISGPRQSPRGGFVLPRFIRQADKGLPITVFDDGSAVRAFTHVADMAKGLVLAMAKGGRGEAYNIGNPDNRTTILQLAEKVIKTLGSGSRIAFVDPKKIYGPLYEGANDKYPDSAKATAELGWVPELGIERVIEDAYEDYRRQKAAGALKEDIAQEQIV